MISVGCAWTHGISTVQLLEDILGKEDDVMVSLERWFTQCSSCNRYEQKKRSNTLLKDKAKEV